MQEYGVGALGAWGAEYDLGRYPAGRPAEDGVAAAAAAVEAAVAAGRGLVTWLVIGPSGAAAEFARRCVTAHHSDAPCSTCCRVPQPTRVTAHARWP